MEAIKQRKRIFIIAENNEGLMCPFKGIVCQKGWCNECQIYLDWKKLGEIIVICAWCGKVTSRKPNFGQPLVSHGICLECKPKYLPKIPSGSR